jgi:hypothetical protein
MFRPSLNEYSEGSTLQRRAAVDDYALNHYEPGLHAPVDDLPIHQVPGNRQYPSVMMDSDIGPGHYDHMNTALTVGNIGVHTVSTGKETTLNPGDGLGLDDEGLHAVNRIATRDVSDVSYHPDVFVPQGNQMEMRQIFNTYDSRDPVNAFNYLFNNINGLQDRKKYFPQIGAGNKLPALGVTSTLDQMDVGLDTELAPRDMKPPKPVAQTVKLAQ